jgi:hypothetical protein
LLSISFFALSLAGIILAFKVRRIEKEIERIDDLEFVVEFQNMRIARLMKIEEEDNDNDK